LIERQNIIKFLGKEVTVIGKDIKIGQIAPEFSATTQEWNQIPVLEKTNNKIRIIASVPSLDTNLCNREEIIFYKQLLDFSKEIVVIIISTDLPFAQKRWRNADGMNQVKILSDHHSVQFGEMYACLLKEPRILRKAIFIINKSGVVEFSEYMSDLEANPDYKVIFRVVKKLLSD